MKLDRLNRTHYWMFVAVLMAAKIALVAALPSADLPITLFLALVVGARFVDVGWPRWLGITLVLLIMVVTTVIVIFMASGLISTGAGPVDAVPRMIWVPTAVLIVLLVVAGVKPTVWVTEASPGT